MNSRSSKIKICHLAMADLAAGAEVQLGILLASLATIPDLEISAILFNEGRLSSELKGLGISVQVIPESQHNSFSIFKQLADYFRQHKIDILHTHKYKDNILGALASARRRVRRRVRTIHGFPEPLVRFDAIRMAFYQMFDHGVNRWLVDNILAVSLDLRGQLINRFGSEKVSCVHNAIDIEKLRVTRCATELRKELKLDGQSFLIGTMGRLVPVKGFESFLKAAQIIRGKKQNVKFIMAGNGPLKNALEALSHEYGLDKDVIFLGHRNDSHDILGLMDLFVLPSFSEGIPMVLLEALALARPVVASRVGGIPEVIEHGVNGLLVAPGRSDELAQSCMALMDDGYVAQALGVAGRKCVEERFSASYMAEQVAAIYRALVCSEER